MMKLDHYQWIVACVASGSLMGCTFNGPASQYQHSYQAHLADFQAPDVDAIVAADPPASETGWQVVFDHSMDRVWEACLEVGTQSWGILDLAREEDGARRMLLVASSPPKSFGRGIKKPIDRWLAVALEPENPTSTRMTLAWINPQGRRVSRHPDLETGNSKRAQIGAEQQSIAGYLRGRFLEDIRAVLTLEEEKLERFSSVSPTFPPRGVYPSEKRRKRRRLKKDAVIRQSGNLESASIRRTNVVLSLPTLETRLRELVGYLSRAVDPGIRIRNVFILSSTNDNAKITSNGDLFVTHGVFKKAAGPDELAGLIAHELAHIKLEDHLFKQKRFQRTRRIAGIVGGVASVGGFLASGILEPEEEPTVGTITANGLTIRTVDLSESGFSTEEVLVGAALGVVGSLVVPQLVHSIGLGIGDERTSEYSQAQELRADELATEFLWYAGYRHDGLLRYMERSVDLVGAKTHGRQN